MVHADIVVDGIHIRLARVDDIVDLSLVHQVQDLVALRQPVYIYGIDAEGADGIRRSRRSVQLKPQVAEFFCKPGELELILVVDRKVHADLALLGRMAEFESCRDKAFEERLLDRFADAEHLARRLHLGPELRIDVVQLFKGEHGHLDGDIRRRTVQPRSVTEFFQLLPDDDLGRKLNHGHARDLGDIRNSARSTRIDLDDIQLVVVDQELNVDEPLCFERKRKLGRTLYDLIQHDVAQIIRRIYRNGVAAVNACTFDMLHDAGDEYVGAVADDVDFQLLPHQIFVAEHGIFDVLRQNDIHIARNIAFGKGDGHVLPADDVGRTQQHGIPELFCRRKRLFLGHDGQSLRAADAELFQKLVEAFPVLRHVHAVRRCTEDTHALLVEIVAQFDRRLPAERDDDAVRFFFVDDVLHILRGQRLKVQPVRRIEVRGDRFGVVVDDDDFVSELFERPYAMHGRIVKLDALPDADRARADNDDALFRTLLNKRRCFVVRIFIVR